MKDTTKRRPLSRRKFIGIAALTGGVALTAGVAALEINYLITPEPAQPQSALGKTNNGKTVPFLVISKENYYDKTLACILGQIAGTLSAYEFVSTSSLPDDWFDLMNGPYAGNFSNWSPPSTANYVIYQGPGKISSNDDWHIDFFNQLIIKEHGINPAFQDIKDEWQTHQVSDWGGGFEAMRLIRDEDMLPPLTGQGEFNRWYWVTEAFIETETIGCIAPGMPVTARDLNEKFARVVAEWEAVWWARFLAAAYSYAYFETDARVAMEKAAATLPRNSWNWQIYRKAQELYEEKPNDWRWSQAEMYNFRRKLNQTDNLMVNPDLLNGTFVLSILYGKNNYLETLQIASLIGNEAIDIASMAAGLLGIIKGLAGTPDLVKDRIYANGEGRMINDFHRDPHINKDYPAEQKFSDIVKIYQDNAEKMIVAKGGHFDETTYYISGQEVKPEKVTLIENADFEQGDLSGWQVWMPQPDSPESPHAYAANNGAAHSGDWNGMVVTDEKISEVKLYVNLSDLEDGLTYRAYAFLQTDQAARLFVDGYGGPLSYAAVVETTNSTHREWVSRSLEFTVKGNQAQVGLHLPPGRPGFALIDNLYVQPITNPARTRYAAKVATLAGPVMRPVNNSPGESYVSGFNKAGDFIQFSLTVPEAGEYRLAINYANGDHALNKLALYLNNFKKADVTFPMTGDWGTFSQNIIYLPVVLQAGSNSLKLQKDDSSGSLDLSYIEVSTYPLWVY